MSNTPDEHGYPDDLRARIIASAWHGGQASYLYSLASTGAITLASTENDDGDPRGEGVDQEIRTELALLRDVDDPALRSGLTWLLGYVAHSGERGPVDGWSCLQWDGETERRVLAEERMQADETDTADYWLYRYADAERIRPATRDEYEASVDAARKDNGAGIIEVDGVHCYVLAEVTERDADRG